MRCTSPKFATLIKIQLDFSCFYEMNQFYHTPNNNRYNKEKQTKMEGNTYEGYAYTARSADHREPFTFRDLNHRDARLYANQYRNTAETNRYPGPRAENEGKKLGEAKVLDMIKKRREERVWHGAMTDRGTTHAPILAKETPQTIVAKKLQEIEEITRDADYFANTISQGASLLQPNISKEASYMNTSTKRENLSTTWKPPLPGSARKLDVFERLTTDARNKHNESKLSKRSDSARKSQDYHNRSASKSMSSQSPCSRIEDKLMNSQKDHDEWICRQRALKQTAELKQMRSGPLISPASSMLARAHAGGYNSLIDRFQALEEARQRRKISKEKERVEAELGSVTGVPEVF